MKLSGMKIVVMMAAPSSRRSSVITHASDRYTIIIDETISQGFDRVANLNDVVHIITEKTLRDP